MTGSNNISPRPRHREALPDFVRVELLVEQEPVLLDVDIEEVSKTDQETAVLFVRSQVLR